MTPTAHSDPSCLDLLDFTPRSATHLALLDDETFGMVFEALVQMILGFLRYATAYEQGKIAELLNDEPNLAALGQVLFGGTATGILARHGNLRLWYTFERRGIVLQKFAFDCNG